MKMNFFKLFLLLFLLLSNFLAFAQVLPGNDDSNGDLEGYDAPAASINTKLIWLAIVGIAFAYYNFSKNKRANLVK